MIERQRNLNRVAARQQMRGQHARLLRQARPRTPLREKSKIELAAIAACTALNSDCPCRDAPSVCDAMVNAAEAVLFVATGRRGP